jgi:hypothetical protein
MTRGFWFGLAFAVLLGCHRGPLEPDDGLTVDAEVYAFGFCALRCFRLDECGFEGGTPYGEPAGLCEEECVDELLETVRDDPCWSEEVELRRCIVDEVECDGLPDEDLPLGAGSPCEDDAATLDACG